MDVADVGKDALHLDALDIHLVLLHLRLNFKIQRVLCSFEPTLFKCPRVERRRGIRLGICSIFCGNPSRIG